MSNTFRRPMFRRGGEAMTGIMGNVTPRVNHSIGTDYTQQLREAAGPYQGVDPLTAWLLRAGPKMMNEPKRGGTFATLARATAEPTEQAIGDINKRAASDRDLRLAGAQMGITQEGKESIWDKRIAAANRDKLSPLDQSILDTTEGYLSANTYTDRNLATNRATYDHDIQGNMIEKFGADQIIDVELVPVKKTKYSRAEEKKKQKFYENNIGKYYYDITDDTIKKIIKDTSDPTGNLLSIDTFDSKTLERIADPVGADIEGAEEIIKKKNGVVVDDYSSYTAEDFMPKSSPDVIDEALKDPEAQGKKITDFWEWVASPKMGKKK